MDFIVCFFEITFKVAFRYGFLRLFIADLNLEHAAIFLMIVDVLISMLVHIYNFCDFRLSAVNNGKIDARLPWLSP